MAKRKSLNRRLSRYTRHSVGSAILDPDTDNLGDEHPYWWENLENNTAIRSSDNFSSLNQTSRHLDSDSQIEASQAKDGWWKALEHSNNSNSLQAKRIRVEKATTKDASTTESEEELRIAKRKLPLRSKLRKTEGNAFLRVLNDSTIRTRLEPVQAPTTRESSVDSSSSSKKVDTNVERSNETQENSLDQSQSRNITGILKSKPNIFRKNCKTQNKNVFFEVLNENELQNVSMGVSFTSSNESEIAIKDTIPAGTETVVHNRLKPSDTWSLENQDGFSDFPVPKAQSTELEDNALSASNSSSTEDMVLSVRKSKFLMRHYTTRQENAFRDVLEEQGVSNEMDKSGSVKKNSAAVDKIHEHSLRSSKNSKTLRKDAADELVISSVWSINETGKDASSKIQKHSLRSSNHSETLREDAADELVISSGRSINETGKDASSKIQKYSLRSSNHSETLRKNAADELVISSGRSINETDKDASSKIQKYSLRSSNHSETLRKNAADELVISSGRSINETGKDASSKIQKYSLRSSKNSETLGKDAADELVTSSVRSVVNETAKETLSSDEATSNDTSSDTDENCRIPKSKRRFLVRSSKNEQTNKFKDSLGETSGVNVSSKSKGSLNREEERNSTIRSIKLTKKKPKLNRDSREDSTDLSNLNLRSSAASNADDNIITTENKNKASISVHEVTSGKKETTKNSILSTNEFKSNDVENIPDKRKSKNLSTSRKGSLSRIAFEETRLENVSQENANGRTNEFMSVVNEVDVEKVETDVNNSLNRSMKRNSSRKRFSFDPSVSYDEEVRNTSNLKEYEIENEIERASRIRGIPSDANELVRSVNREKKIGENRASSSVKEIGKSLATNSNSNKIPIGQTSIRNFFKSGRMLPASQVFSDKGKIEEIKNELTRVKELELARMKREDKKAVEAKVSRRGKKLNAVGTGTKAKSQAKRDSKQIHKAYLVNGQPWRAPKLPRPQRWITDRLYKYLWNCMEPKFKLETRIASEKFIHQLSNVTTLIMKRESYLDYQIELNALIKEMARLGIVRTRNDFYNFCHDFFPYELRVKTVPMLLPGNKKNIPYNADTLHAPLLDA